LVVVDRTFPDRIGWKDVVIAPAADPTGDLTHYPMAMLSSPRDVNSADLQRLANGRWVAASHVAPTAAAAAPASQVRSNALADMLARGPSSIVVVLLTLLAAIGLGALHALEPGHGKTLLAVSLVGARATPKQAILLAAALTLAHTTGVICLGLALLIAAPWIVPETVYPWLTAVSGLAVACLGASALARFVRARRGGAAAHTHDGSDAWPTIKVGTTEHEQPTIKVGTTEHGHDHDHAIPGDAPISFRGVVLIAMSGNIAPCPAALVVMLAALASHQLGYGLAIIVAFGVGLAGVLTGLGIAVVRGAASIARRPRLQRLVAFGPLASACAISTIGALLFANGLSSGVIRAPGWPVILLTLSAIAGYAMRPGHAHTHTQPHYESPNAA
jgi:nickel/cobalt transporter (NicO) family protein